MDRRTLPGLSTWTLGELDETRWDQSSSEPAIPQLPPVTGDAASFLARLYLLSVLGLVQHEITDEMAQHRSSRISALSKQVTLSLFPFVLLHRPSTPHMMHCSPILICHSGTCGNQRRRGQKPSGIKVVAKDWSGRRQTTYLLSSSESFSCTPWRTTLWV